MRLLLLQIWCRCQGDCTFWSARSHGWRSTWWWLDTTTPSFDWKRSRYGGIAWWRGFHCHSAEEYGLINRALSAAELGPFVEKLAKRIASFPAHTVAGIKASVNLGTQASLPSGLLVEAHQADLVVANDITRKRVAEGLSLGIEKVEGEIDLPSFASKLSPPS
ncbi:hypothetical protein MRB53_039352 [Persea americana]|nr:hypothetical protein MRB53_039352 [Persea americana]